MRTIISMATVLLALPAVLPPVPAEALQVPTQDADVVDRVVAWVGDSAILQSQIDEEIERLRLMGADQIPEAGPELDALRSQVLDSWVNLMLILVAADLDSLVQVPPEAVEEQVSAEIDRVTQRLGGQPQLQQALAQEGMTLAEYREMTRSQIAQQQTRQAFIAIRLRDASQPVLTEADILETFEAMRDNLQQRPKTITFRQVVVVPTPSDSAVTAARVLAGDLRRRIMAGEPFDSLARAHSDDPGSGALGGDLGWFRRGRMVPEFDDAVFAMIEDQVSDPVESQFGFHIIRLDRTRSVERRASHILIRPELSAQNMEEAAAKADSVVALAREGVSMSELFGLYSDPGAPDSLTVPITQLSELPPGYEVMAGAETGQVLGPITYSTAQNETRLAVVLVTEVREAGAYTLEDLRVQITEQMSQERQIEAILADLRSRTHIELLHR